MPMLGMRSCSTLFVLASACGPDAGNQDDGVVDTSTSATTRPADDTVEPGDSVADVSDEATTSATDTDGDTTTDATTSAMDGTADESTGGKAPSGPTHLLLIRTPHGVFADDAWTGSGEGFALGPVLEPLTPWSDALVLVDGVDNVILPPQGEAITNVYGVASASLLTGGLLGSATGEPDFAFYFGGGPSLDIALGDVVGGASLHANVHLGVQAADGAWPSGASYLDADQPFLAMDSPELAFSALFTGFEDPVLDDLEGQLAQPIDSPGDVLELQLSIAHAAIALDVTRVQLLSIDRGLPSIVWTDVGASSPYHDLVAENNPAAIRPVQILWAERIAVLLARLEADDLLDRTLVVWLAAEGSPPAAYPTDDIFAVIVDRSGTFATGRIADVEADQADFAVTIAEAMNAPLPGFGHPDLDATVVEELLAR